MGPAWYTLKALKQTCGFLILLICGCAPPFPEGRFTVRLTDDDGRPVAAANVIASDLNDTARGNTDQNGMFLVRIASPKGAVDIHAEKNGYYSIGRVIYEFQGHDDERYYPWNGVLELPLHKVGTPVPMLVRSLRGVRIPKLDTPVGFDLVRGDWIAPDGNGQTEDFQVVAKCQINGANDFESSLSILFKNLADGMVRKALPQRNDYGLRLAAIAPDSGYTNQFQFVLNARWNPKTRRREMTTNIAEDDNFYFRVRTVLDERGSVATAFYGKIYDGIHFDPGVSPDGHPAISFEYYLNPDGTRNTEWDVRSNLCSNPGDISLRP